MASRPTQRTAKKRPKADPVREAADYGIDIAQLRDNLALTPAERMRRHDIALTTAETLRKARRP